jgi:hypothetical protein
VGTVTAGAGADAAGTDATAGAEAAVDGGNEAAD